MSAFNWIIGFCCLLYPTRIVGQETVVDQRNPTDEMHGRLIVALLQSGDLGNITLEPNDKEG